MYFQTSGRRGWLWVACAAAALWSGASFAGEMPNPQNGPCPLVSASWLGGTGEDELVSCAVAPDGTVLVAGNTSDYAPAAPVKTVLGSGQASGKHGFIARLSADGQKIEAFHTLAGGEIRQIRVNAKGDIFVLASSGSGRGASGSLAQVPAGGGAPIWSFTVSGATEFGLDSNGDVVVLAGTSLQRFAAGASQPAWKVTWKCYGNNVPGGMDVNPATGVAVVCGYGMTKTGHEPYKDPYAYGFDREGKQLWGIWNPDPTLEAAGPGKNGLMADSSGQFVSTGAGGKVFIGMKSDGGNTVMNRNPLDPFKPLDRAVTAGAYQGGPPGGMKGASSLPVLFRADAKTGKLERATWINAFSGGHPNGMGIARAASDGRGTYLVGGSADGCPIQNPWYVARPGGYRGGGFLAVFDNEFRMAQCGYFPGTKIEDVAVGPKVVVIVGSAGEKATNHALAAKGAAAGPEVTTPVPSFRPVQGKYGGGTSDGFVAIFRAAAGG